MPPPQVPPSRRADRGTALLHTALLRSAARHRSGARRGAFERPRCRLTSIEHTYDNKNSINILAHSRLRHAPHSHNVTGQI
eukprot:scaffold25748_cov39-Phaeocystis_antarctica.AAC.1